MNKKQLIAAWVMGILSSIILFYELGNFTKIGHLTFYKPSGYSYLGVILIIGSLLIYTLRGKKK